MFLWLIKQLLNIRKVLDSRKHPHQLAWGLAFGFLVGVVPHGNLMAVVLIVLVLSLRVNHSLAALTGVTVALLATKLDPLTHQIGHFVLSDPRWHDSLMTAWQWPLMPWTDLNNTVVVGSLLLGVGMVLPLYAISYPVFRYFQPAAEEEPAPAQPPTSEVVEPKFEKFGPKPTVIESSVISVPPAAETDEPAVEIVEATSNAIEPTVQWLDADNRATAPGDRDLIVAETPVDVIRVTECDGEQPDSRTELDASNEVPMNQALGYLLRRLRDSKQGDAA